MLIWITRTQLSTHNLMDTIAHLRRGTGQFELVQFIQNVPQHAILPIFIRPGELIVGQRAATLAGRAVYPEFNLNGLTQ